MLPAGNRRWQRVVDAYENDEDKEVDDLITDKTRLLTKASSSTCTLVDVNQAHKDEVHAHVGQAQQGEGLSESTWRCKKDTRTTGRPELGNSYQSKRSHTQNPTPSFPIKKHCNHASWQGFRQLLRKQFTPPFPFGKGLLLPEEMQHLRQRRIEGVMHRPSKVLCTSTNLVELRKLDAKIQNGINKSAFSASSKRSRPKENMPCNHNHNLGTSKRSMKLSSQDYANENAEVTDLNSSADDLMHLRCLKQNSIFRKLTRPTKKDNGTSLLANAMK